MPKLGTPVPTTARKTRVVVTTPSFLLRTSPPSSRKYFFRAGGPRRKWKFHIWIFSHSFPCPRLLTGCLVVPSQKSGTIATPPPCHPALISDDGTLVFSALSPSLSALCHPASFGKGNLSFLRSVSSPRSSAAPKIILSSNCVILGELQLALLIRASTSARLGNI